MYVLLLLLIVSIFYCQFRSRASCYGSNSPLIGQMLELGDDELTLLEIAINETNTKECVSICIFKQNISK